MRREAERKRRLLKTSPEVMSTEGWESGGVGMIVREKEPLSLESPLSALESFLTPNELFYVRNHFSTPKLDVESYELRIDGAVAHPLTIRYDELRRMPSRKCTVTLECAGNSRVFLLPQTDGVQWELGAVGNAEWTGVPLDYLLRRTEVLEGALEVVLEGADEGELTNSPAPCGSIKFARSLPISAAREQGVMLAYKMNGSALPVEHGFPVRAIVPGHYAMASVKWLTHIRVVRQRFQGYWQTAEYAYWEGSEASAVRRPVGSMMVKAVITQPRAHEVVAANTPYRISGVAWTGESDITGVEVTADGGESWHAACLVDPVLRYAWRRWEYKWSTPAQPGRYTLFARARDRAGAIQPDKHDRNWGSYGVHHTLPIDVFVAGSAARPARDANHKW
jgi:DMSO/TMAO reductase YedYZ molybdopterin-dependent catalytic subunit